MTATGDGVRLKERHEDMGNGASRTLFHAVVN